MSILVLNRIASVIIKINISVDLNHTRVAPEEVLAIIRHNHMASMVKVMPVNKEMVVGEVVIQVTVLVDSMIAVIMEVINLELIGVHTGRLEDMQEQVILTLLPTAVVAKAPVHRVMVEVDIAAVLVDIAANLLEDMMIEVDMPQEVVMVCTKNNNFYYIFFITTD